ncbi:group II intron maturase-specific domain-containing protein [Singulisphaera sp. Ch08]
MTKELNSFLTGWVTYFRLAECKTHLRALDGWIRRKLRCVRLKHCKRAKTLAHFFQSLGVPAWNSWATSASGKGWWRLSGSPTAHHAMSTNWFESLGLVNLVQRYVQLNR